MRRYKIKNAKICSFTGQNLFLSYFLEAIFWRKSLKNLCFFKKTPLKNQHNFLQFYTDFKIYLYVLKLVFRRLKIRLKNVEFYVQEL
jgi:hypothetical protein